MNTKLYSQMKRMLLLGVFLLSTFLTFAQDRRVTGNVNASDGGSIPGASIKIKGTNTGTVTNGTGDFAINVKSGNEVLIVSSVGYKTLEVAVGSRSVVNVSMQSDVSALDEVVVTGYQQIRKRDITGAVSVINAGELKEIKTSSFTQALAGRATGVTISTSGSPGDATNVRIRGISSFTNNDPLYVIDGVPMQDKYMNQISPDDIESIQVLKDASTSSIYGSRASNGVIVITTKQGKVGKTKFTYSGSYGVANPVKGYDEVLNTSSAVFAQALKQKFGADAPAWMSGTLPKYIMPSSNTVDLTTYNEQTNQITETNQVGTNWWKEMTRPAAIQNHSIGVSGGNDASTFSITGSYSANEGVLLHNSFQRATLRANSQFKVGKNIRIGENLQVSSVWGIGIGSIGGNNNEQSIFGDLFKASPVTSVYDIKGQPGSNLNTLGVAQNFNVVARLNNNKDNGYSYVRILGNAYAEIDVIKGLTLRSSFGVDNNSGFNKAFNYTAFWKKEPITDNNFGENWNRSFGWTWTNTAAYKTTIANKHNVGVLIGQEAISYAGRNIGSSLASYFTTDINAWYINTAFGNPTSRQVNSSGNESKLASYFGKVDYSFNDRYLLSATIRRDGSSKFLSDVRYGIFPAVSAGWRVSEEGFMKEIPFVSDLKIRGGYGELGNQQINDYNFSDNYGGSVASTFYDINGNNSTPSTGYALRSRGNASTIWESSKTTNFGVDAAFLNNTLTFVLDIYKRNTENLLFNPPLPGTAGSASAPFVNVGAMQNTGYDITLGYRTKIAKDLNFNTSINLSHYRNEIVRIAGTQTEFFPTDGLTERFPQGSSVYTNRIGSPISSFQGYVTDGFITSEAEVKKQVGSAIGGLKFKDINNDNVIDDKDLQIIGSPHPDLVAGWNIGLNYKAFDFNAFLFGSFGNQIFNATKIQTVFLNFNSNPIKDILTNPTYPKINGLDASSRSASSFYVEDGSYVRLANLQVGYNVPTTFTKKYGMSNVRLYVQGQNLFTITKYTGADPAVSNANIGNNGQVNDLRTGYDNGNYPSNKMLTFGVNLGI